jgi:uncharacterized membrane protein
VHFPIALLFTSVFFDLMGSMTGNKNFRQTAFWLLILGLIGGIAAAVFGAWNEEMVEAAGVPEMAVDRHETLAIITLVVFGILLAYRWWTLNRWSAQNHVIYLSVAMLGLLLLSVTGFYGGELVYRYGAGVKSSSTPLPAPVSPP